jgi:hypothetical protein
MQTLTATPHPQQLRHRRNFTSCVSDCLGAGGSFAFNKGYPYTPTTTDTTW